MSLPKVVSRAEWLTARKELLAQEKELTRRRDALSAERRRLPMVEIDKAYVFTGPGGEEKSLLDLFEGRLQLILVHFMFDPEWENGCPSCTAGTDEMSDGLMEHVAIRDTSMVWVSRAPIEKLEAYKAARGWTIPWYSSYGSDFNYDFGVSPTRGDAPAEYNFRAASRALAGEFPGTSVFLRVDDRVFHTYSSFARGAEWTGGSYAFLDLTALGRQEDWEEPKGRSESCRSIPARDHARRGRAATGDRVPSPPIPSSSKEPSRASGGVKRASSGPATGSGARKWIVRSIVGAGVQVAQARPERGVLAVGQHAHRRAVERARLARGRASRRLPLVRAGERRRAEARLDGQPLRRTAARPGAALAAAPAGRLDVRASARRRHRARPRRRERAERRARPACRPARAAPVTVVSERPGRSTGVACTGPSSAGAGSARERARLRRDRRRGSIARASERHHVAAVRAARRRPAVRDLCLRHRRRARVVVEAVARVDGGTLGRVTTPSRCRSRPRWSCPAPTVRENLGIAFGLVVRSMGLTRNVTAGFRSLRKGEVHASTPSCSRTPAATRSTGWSPTPSCSAPTRSSSMRFDSSEMGNVADGGRGLRDRRRGRRAA